MLSYLMLKEQLLQIKKSFQKTIADTKAELIIIEKAISECDKNSETQPHLFFEVGNPVPSRKRNGLNIINATKTIISNLDDNKLFNKQFIHKKLAKEYPQFKYTPLSTINITISRLHKRDNFIEQIVKGGGRRPSKYKKAAIN